MGFSSSGGAKVGTIEMWGGNTAPDGHLICDGGAISRTVYKDLFDAIGTTYGAGDGTTTFNLPNFASGKVITGNFPVVGNGKTLGFLANSGATTSVTIGEGMNILNYTDTIGKNPGLKSIGNDTAIGVDTNSSKSGLITKLSNFQSVKYIIKY